MEDDFRIGEWLVQRKLNRIVGRQGEVPVEFKSMEVLVCLAKNGREVVEKEELIQSVWPDAFVTDDVLHRAISELRKVFGDTPRDPRVIQTVHRRGYRLIAPVSSPHKPKERYRILETIGEGGVARVFLAEDRLLNRRVAVKKIKLGMDTREILGRFQLEQGVLALLDHPYIARVHDSGITSDGRAYFVMEHVAGSPITEYCDQNRLPIGARLELFTKVCQAVHHAHRKGIIHRDIKPSNVLVKVERNQAIPKLIDFGLAKALGPTLTEKTIFTKAGQAVIGSPSFMSPEQIAMSQDIDAATDIYSMGVLLYKLLTGMTPFGPERLQAAARGDLLRIVRDEVIESPSTRLRHCWTSQFDGRSGDEAPNESQLSLNRIAAERGTDPHSLIQSIHGDLDWIVMKAMASDRTRRCESASDLQKDIRRHLEHRPVDAGPPSLSYRASKFIRRHRRALPVGAALVLAALVSLVSLVYSYIEVRHERDTAEAARELAVANEITARRMAYRAGLLAAEAALVQNDVVLADKRLGEAPPEMRGWEWRHLQSRTRQSIQVLSGLRRQPDALKFSSDRRLLLSIGHFDAALRVWDLERGRQKSMKALWSLSYAAAAHFIDNETQILFQGFDTDTGNSNVSIVETEDLEESRRISIPGRIQVDPLRKRVYALDVAGCRRMEGRDVCDLTIWDLAGGDVIASRRWSSVPIGSLAQDHLWAISPDGAFLLLWRGREAWILDSGTLKTRARLNACPGCPEGRVRNIVDGSFTAENKGAVLVCTDSTIMAFDVQGGGPIFERSADGAGWRKVAVSPTRRMFATVGNDDAVRLWRLPEGEPIRMLRGHSDRVNTLVFSEDGDRLASAGNREIHLWDVHEPDNPIVLKGHESLVQPVTVSPDGSRIYSGGWDGYVGKKGALRFWTSKGRPLATLGEKDWIVYSLAVSPDGRRLAVGVSSFGSESPPKAFDHRVEIIDTASGERLTTLGGFDSQIHSLQFHPSLNSLLVGGPPMQVWKLSPQELIHSFGTVDLETKAVFSHDGQWIAAGAIDSSIKIWDGRTFTLSQKLTGHEGGILSLLFSPDDSRLFSSSRDMSVRVWDWRNGREETRLDLDSTAATSALAIMDDGSRLASAGEDGVIRIWEGRTLAELVQLRGHTGHVHSLEWGPNGTWLVSGSVDGTLRLWR